MTTIENSTNPVTAVMFAVLGGRFRVRLTSEDVPGQRHGEVLDDHGNVIGDAADWIYSGRGFAIHTAPFAGFVEVGQIEFVSRCSVVPS